MSVIVQISDPHLLSDRAGKLKRVPTAESLRLVLKQARREVPQPSRVVLSGDLSHEHTVSGYEILQDLLGDWADRSLLIPGNHDDRGGMRKVFTQIPGHLEEEVWFDELCDGWRLVGIDSHVPGELYGELGRDTLNRLRESLMGGPQQSVLLFVHHPPLAVNSPWLDQIRLRNADELEAIVQSSASVRGVFGGHIHQEFEAEFAGVPFFTAPSASFQFVPETEVMQFDRRPPGFRIIELGPAIDGTLHTRVVRLRNLEFEPSDES